MGMYRTPRTRQERAAFEAALHASAEIGVRIDGIRAKRAPCHLPTDWSDIPAARRGKCWKAHRKTQWREKHGRRWAMTKMIESLRRLKRKFAR